MPQYRTISQFHTSQHTQDIGWNFRQLYGLMVCIASFLSPATYKYRLIACKDCKFWIVPDLTSIHKNWVVNFIMSLCDTYVAAIACLKSAMSWLGHRCESFIVITGEGFRKLPSDAAEPDCSKVSEVLVDRLIFCGVKDLVRQKDLDNAVITAKISALLTASLRTVVSFLIFSSALARIYTCSTIPYLLVLYEGLSKTKFVLHYVLLQYLLPDSFQYIWILTSFLD